MARTIGPVLYSSGRGIRAPDQVARRAPRRSADAPLYLLAETCLERILEEIARAQAGARHRRLDPDGVLAQVPVGARQHRPGARSGDAAAVRRKGAEHPDVPRRSRHEGRQPRRPEGARARRRHGPLLRGRAPPLAPRRARRQEPLRRRQRARRLRDDRAAACGRCRIPRKLFLAERPSNAPGSAVLCSVEGSRPILVEVQALVSTSTYGTARRMASGIDQQRLSLLLAVLEKRAGLNLVGDDVFVNIAGGMTVDEPASDLGVVAAIASSVRNRAIAADDRRCSARSGSPARCAGISQARAAGSRGGADGVHAAASCPRPTSIRRSRIVDRRRLRARWRPHGRRGARPPSWLAMSWVDPGGACRQLPRLLVWSRLCQRGSRMTWFALARV